LDKTSLGARKGAVFAAAVPSNTKLHHLSKKHKPHQNLEVCHMAAMRRELVWVEKRNFQGWACTECAWVFKPSGTFTGRSLDEMKENYEQQRDKEFNLTSVPSTREPKGIRTSQITRGLNVGLSCSSKPYPSKQERAG